MELHGKIIVIKRNGSHGIGFPLSVRSCIIGRSPDCDIRIQFNEVQLMHCRLDVQDDGQVVLCSLSDAGRTLVNGSPVPPGGVALAHGDVFTVHHRSFR
ncbi:unnamed protein product [Lampetra planeri]